jgi:hypothetical protein
MSLGLPRRARAFAYAGGAWLLFSLLGCSRAPEAQKRQRSAPSAGSGSESLARVAPPEATPERLATLEVSAYAATLAADDETIYVLTEHAAYGLSPDRAPARWDIELGLLPALGKRGFVYWLDGELRVAPKQGGKPEVLARVPNMPKKLSVTGERVAWLEVEAGTTTLRTLYGSEPRVAYRSEGELEALTIVDDQAYFVERRSGEWRLGGAPLSGGAPRFSAPHVARAPAMLASSDDVFYYDGPTSSVRRVSTDLSRESTTARDVICSPIAVTFRVYCAAVSLLFEAPKDGGPARVLTAKRGGTIAALVATPKRLAWLLEAGQNRTEVEAITTAAPRAP